jgi:PAB1-binding protein PBP1
MQAHGPTNPPLCRPAWHARARAAHLNMPASMPFSFHMYTPSATPSAVMPLLRTGTGMQW